MEMQEGTGETKHRWEKTLLWVEKESTQKAWAMDLHDLAPRVGVYW